MPRNMITFVLFLFAVSSYAAPTKQISIQYSFERPSIQEISIEGVSYQRVIMTNAPSEGNIGHPALPASGAQILIPAGADVDNIEIVPGEKVLLGSNFLIEPVGIPVKLSSDPTDTEPPTPNDAIYSLDSPFPTSYFENIGTHNFRGYQILTLKLQPVQYIPSTGELFYFRNLTVNVNTIDTDRLSSLFRGLDADKIEVNAKVDNPQMTDTYITTSMRNTKGYDLLIITIPGLVDEFQTLKDYHDNNGIATEIHTTVEIGVANADNIRDYITEKYLNDDIQYVIIGGDDDIIPAKDLYVESWNGGEVEYNMPSDVYYACLDGTYNYDGDSRWGEPNDGDGGGDVDLIAEVYVGRASVGNSTEAARFVNKTISYLSNQNWHIEKALMVGEHLGFGGESEYAAGMMDQNVDSSSADGYYTIGIPSIQYEVDRLYDLTWPGNDWPQSELVSRINSGLHIINHLGHGSSDYAMKLTNGALSALTNTDHFFAYSQTCLAGHFDNAECWAETVTIKSDYGAFAVVMNARFGWGSGNSTDGPSQRFNREFWDAVYNPSESKRELGRALQDSKEDNLYRVNQSCMRWIYYESNLFGDPTVAIKGAGAWFTVDSSAGWVPFNATFSGMSSLDVASWTWDFGDGDSAFVQTPSHTYESRGLFDVGFQIITTGGDTISRVNSAFVAALADTLYADSVQAIPGDITEINIYATNTIPLSEIIIPVEFSGTIDLDAATISWSTVGCRSESLDYQQQIHLDPGNKRMTFRLANEGSSSDLSPGSGPILKLFFELATPPIYGQETPILLDGYNTYTPWFEGNIAQYEPRIASGSIAYNSCCTNIRGNVDGDPNDQIEIVDLLFLINYMFNQGIEPVCLKEANVDGDLFEQIDIADLIYLTNYMFQNGPEPAICF